MKNFLLLFAFLMNICCVAFGQEYSVIEPELQQLLSGCNNEKVSITVVLKSQADASALRAKAAACRNSKMARAAVVRALKEHSAESQNSLLSFLHEEEKNGNVSNISHLWIANTVCCDAVADVVCQLALRDDVLAIGCNREVQMIQCSKESFAQYAAQARASSFPHTMQVRATDAWEQGYTGKNVVVAVIDSGTNDEHLDLKDHLWQGYADTDGDGEADDLINGWNYSVTDAAGNANIKDDYGHGTHCAGIVCGDGTSGNVAGIAPDAILMTLKTINSVGGGSPANMMKGVQFAVENGADILSLSSGFKSNQIGASDKEALRRTFESALSAGVIAFVAAGNDGKAEGDAKYVDYPAACPPPYLHPDQQVNGGGLSSVVCVGAVDSYDEYASFSSQGPVTWQNTAFNDYPYTAGDSKKIGLIRPDICAPGDFIYSLKHDDNDKYKINSGTSQATPCAAGIAALMLEKNGTLTPADICRIMETTAVKLSENKNNLTGSGRVDALNALNAVEAAEGKPFVKVTNYTPEHIAQGNNREIRLTITNQGRKECSENAIVTLSTDDSRITLPNATMQLGRLAPSAEKQIVFPVNISADVANGSTLYMRAIITDGSYSWTDEMEIRVSSSAKLLGSVNSSTVVGAGRDVTLDVNIVNVGTVATTSESKLTLETNSPYVTFINSETTMDVIAPGETKVAKFNFKVSADAPDASSLQFDLYAVPNNYNDVKGLVYGFEQHIDSYGYLEDGFEGWTTFDASNDGRNHPWWHSTYAVKHRMQVPGTSYSGKGHLVSETYCNGSNQEYKLPIDNYLVSPKIKATASSEFKFRARVHSSAFYGEHFGVAVSESGNKDASSFKTIQEWKITKEYGKDWLEFSVDLSEYAGKEIYVAIRHFFTEQEWIDSYNGYDFYALHVDDATFVDIVDVSTIFVYDNYSYFSVKVDYNAPESSVDTLESDADALIEVVDGRIVVSGAVEGSVIALYDMCGRNVYNIVAGADAVHIDAGALGKGIYLVKVEHKYGVSVKKVLVH